MFFFKIILTVSFLEEETTRLQTSAGEYFCQSAQKILMRTELLKGVPRDLEAIKLLTFPELPTKELLL